MLSENEPFVNLYRSRSLLLNNNNVSTRNFEEVFTDTGEWTNDSFNTD